MKIKKNILKGIFCLMGVVLFSWVLAFLYEIKSEWMTVPIAISAIVICGGFFIFAIVNFMNETI